MDFVKVLAHNIVYQSCLKGGKKVWIKTKIDGALLTDLSKAFDCLNRELLIAKLEAYCFDFQSLTHIYSYLSNRKPRTKIKPSVRGLILSQVFHRDQC